MDVIKIIERYYHPDSKAYRLLLHHSKLVTQKALLIADRLPKLHPDTDFIEEASMLHDIGIFMTYSPKIGCHGIHPYICHGYLGKELLDNEGLPRHALVCERHVGIGITTDDIDINELPLPKRDMMPLSLEEKIICFADKFYSKAEPSVTQEKSVREIKDMIGRFGNEKLRRFEEWMVLFRE
ncbi:MAG: HD domain-containing protein [Dissulfurispiraceae bacterium]